jgi:hypothetical protein
MEAVVAAVAIVNWMVVCSVVGIVILTKIAVETVRGLVWHPVSLMHRLWEDCSVDVGVSIRSVDAWGFSVLAGDWLVVVPAGAGHLSVGWFVEDLMGWRRDELLLSWLGSILVASGATFCSLDQTLKKRLVPWVSIASMAMFSGQAHCKE